MGIANRVAGNRARPSSGPATFRMRFIQPRALAGRKCRPRSFGRDEQYLFMSRQTGEIFLCQIILALVFLGGGMLSSFSATPNYLIRSWQSESGLPQNKVTAVVQAYDGYLWVGTYSGLIRFDGVEGSRFLTRTTRRRY